MSAAVGVDIQASCTKCGVVWHVVVAKVGEKLAKVECKECGAVHRYKAAPGVAKPKATRKTTTRKKKDEPIVEFDPAKPVRPYSVRETFEVAERIEHPSFGVGVVETIPGLGKIGVAFPEGRKVLVHAKSVPVKHQ